MLSEHFSKQIKSYPLLTREEERELLSRAQKGDAAARDRLVNSNLRFVLKQAHRLKGYMNSSISFEGLFQEGVTGLCEAIDRFDLSTKNRFITYAVWWINARLNRYIVRNFSIVKFGTTQAERSLFFKASEVMDLLEIRDPDLREQERERIAKERKVRIEDVRSFERRAHDTVLEFDRPLAFSASPRDKELTLYDRVPSFDVHQVEESDFNRRIMDIFNEAPLTPKEFVIVAKRFLEEHKSTLQAIGDELGVSRERVRQIESQALRKLRKHFESQGHDLESLGLVA